MGGETDASVSGWTVDTARAHLASIIDANDRRYAARFAAQEVAMSAALAAAEKAVLKAEMASERRFEAVNEFRAQLADQAATFIPRIEAEARIARNTDDLAGLASRLDRYEGRTGGVAASWGYLVGAAGVASAVVALIAR